MPYHQLDLSPYRQSFEFRNDPNRNTFSASDQVGFSYFYNLSCKKKEIKRLLYTNDKDFLEVVWFEPRRIRTGFERVYCVLSYGSYCNDNTVYWAEYSGGYGLNKVDHSFYGILYKMRLQLFKEGQHTTAHYCIPDVIPALIKKIHAEDHTLDLSKWNVYTYSY